MAISQYYVGYHESSGENVTAFPRLHPKGASSRFALRAPRPPRGLAMTNRGGYYRFIVNLFQSFVQRRERHAAPLHWPLRAGEIAMGANALAMTSRERLPF